MLLTLLIAFASLISLMIIHEFGHFIIAKKFGVKVEEFGIGYPPKLFGRKFGETIYSVNLIPLGAFVRIYGEEGGVDDYRSFAKLALWKRVWIVMGGVLAFWVASAIIFSAVFLTGAVVPVGDQDINGFYNAKLKITSVEQNSPAQSAGLKKNDEILSINGRWLNKTSDFQNIVQENKGNNIAIKAIRNGSEIEINLTPRISYPKNQGPVGVSLERMATIIEKSPWYQAPFKGIIYTGQITWQAIVGIYNVFANLFSGNGVPKGAEFAGPVGITIFLAKAADYGFGFFMYFIGSISVFIALFNLFPIPALDGGKLLFMAIEKIIKRPVSLKIEQSLSMVFFILLITLSIFVTIKFDVPRAIEFWKAGLR
ncbi:MAG: M50 family metallopeptidase [Patescibacteria group bacterium]